MVNISNVKSAVNIFIPKTGAKFVENPKVVSVLKADFKNFRPATDVFETSFDKHLSVDDVRRLFPSGKINADFLVKKMRKVKTGLFFSSLTSFKDFKTWMHSVNLSKKLSDSDFLEITDFMNLYKGKYIDIWKGFSSFDSFANKDKLALFTRSIKRIDKLNFYKNLPEKHWEICIDGIVNRPESVVEALMKYKFDSRKINNAIVFGTKSEKIKKYINEIEKFLGSQTIKHNIEAFRGEGHLGILSNVKVSRDKSLQDIIEKFTSEIEKGMHSQKDISKFINRYLFKQNIKQERFLSTAIEKEAGERYAKKLLWHLNIPEGTRGSMIESYNVERASEAELLLQKGSRMIIDNAKYNKEKNIWELWATVRQ